MAASKDGFAVLDIQNDDQELDLQFQDFGDTRTQSGGGGGGGKHEQTILFTDFPDSAEDDQQESDKLMGTEGDSSDPRSLKAGPSFWTFEFYQQFFDVESKQVGDRILWSMVPKPGVSYLQTYIRPNPDLYGPFWICLTLTFATGITGNLANYLAATTEQTVVWRYEFRKVTLAASAIFAYAWLVPLAVWGVLAMRGSRAKISLLELLSIYGYSLAIFVPVSVLWMVPQPWFQWCLAIVAPVLSGTVLVRTIWPSLSHDSKQVAIGIAVVILLLHATLALGFMLYFFSPPEAKPNTPIVPLAPSANKSADAVKTLPEDAEKKTDGETVKKTEEGPTKKVERGNLETIDKNVKKALEDGDKIGKDSPGTVDGSVKDKVRKDKEGDLDTTKGSVKKALEDGGKKIGSEDSQDKTNLNVKKDLEDKDSNKKIGETGDLDTMKKSLEKTLGKKIGKDSKDMMNLNAKKDLVDSDKEIGVEKSPSKPQPVDPINPNLSDTKVNKDLNSKDGNDPIGNPNPLNPKAEEVSM